MMRRVSSVVAVLLVAAPGAAQERERTRDRDRLVESCSSAAVCLEGALATEAILAGVGLAHSGGSELPGSPSTLGRRVGSSPRLALAVRFGMVQFDHPSLGDVPDRSKGVWAPSVQGELALGVFEGFQVKPTVGGVLSVDALVTYGVAFPRSDGFDGSTGAFGYGLRVGALRESFTLPAVTVALARRHVGGVEYASTTSGVSIDDATVTSFRASVGKEFLALGILGGLGWERVDGDGEFRTPGAGVIPFEGFQADRLLLYGGLTRTWLILQGSVEGGFATGFDARPAGSGGDFDPTRGSIFGSLSFRLLL